MNWSLRYTDHVWVLFRLAHSNMTYCPLLKSSCFSGLFPSIFWNTDLNFSIWICINVKRTDQVRVLSCLTYFNTKYRPLLKFGFRIFTLQPLKILTSFLYARLQTGRIMVWWCPSGSPSGSPSVRPSIRPSVRLSVRPVSVRPFSALFSYMLWHIEPKFCTWLCFDVLQIKFDCRHFVSIFEGVMPLCELRIKVMCSFPHFSPTCFDILSSNFAYDFVSPYCRSSSSAVNLR